MKKLILASAIAFSCATPAMAQGIPTYDATAVMKMIEQATAMANQLVELKNQVKALTDFKGFAEELTGIGDEISNALSSLKDNVVSAAQEAINFKDLQEIYSKQLDKQLAKVEELSKRIQSAPDTKAMSEIQAEIGLRQQAIDIMKEQKAMADKQIELEEQAAITSISIMRNQNGAGFGAPLSNNTRSLDSEPVYPADSDSPFDDILRN